MAHAEKLIKLSAIAQTECLLKVAFNTKTSLFLTVAFVFRKHVADFQPLENEIQTKKQQLFGELTYDIQKQTQLNEALGKAKAEQEQLLSELKRAMQTLQHSARSHSVMDELESTLWPIDEREQILEQKLKAAPRVVASGPKPNRNKRDFLL